MNDLSDKIKLKIEQDFVKNTYNSIAESFSDTRYKKWFQVDKFLKELPSGSTLLDIGCGNGKYLDNERTFNMGCDVSNNLLKICKSRGFEVVNCDMMRLPFKKDHFDAIICIAALHHIVTAERRQQCLEAMIDLLSARNESNRMLIQVWSYEQDLVKNNPYLKSSKSTDVSGEQTPLIKEVLIEEDESKIEIPIHKNRTPFTSQDMLVPFKTKRNKSPSIGQDSEEAGASKEMENLRYYHLFREDELESMLTRIEHVKILESYYDLGNWCVVATKSLADHQIL